MEGNYWAVKIQIIGSGFLPVFRPNVLIWSRKLEYMICGADQTFSPSSWSYWNKTIFDYPINCEEHQFIAKNEISCLLISPQLNGNIS